MDARAAVRGRRGHRIGPGGGGAGPARGRDARVAGIEYGIRRTAGENTEYWALSPSGPGLAELAEARPGGTYRARARYVARNGALPSPWTESAETTVAGFGELDVPVNATVTAIAGGYVVSWGCAAAARLRLHGDP